MQQVGSIVRSNWVRCTGIELLERGLAGDANDQILYELHFIAYTRLQRPDLAIAHYQAALQIGIYPEAETGAYNNRQLEEGGWRLTGLKGL